MIIECYSCPDYSSIPPVCHMVYKQGECPTVQCPTNVTVTPIPILVTVPGQYNIIIILHHQEICLKGNC